MPHECDTLSKSQILENIPHQYCAHVLSVLNVHSSPSYCARSNGETIKLLSRKITREQALYLYKQWKIDSSPVYAAKYLKKPDGVALSVLISMNLRKKGFCVETEVLLNGRYCDIVVFNGEPADEIWAIEVKSPRDVWQRGINQCKEYSVWSDKSLLMVMDSTRTIMAKPMESCIGVAVLEKGDFKIVREPVGEFQCTKQSFEIFTVPQLKKIIQSITGRCPKHNKRKLIDFLFRLLSVNELERIFRIFFAEKVRTSSLFNLTSVELEVLAAYLMRTAFQEVREAGGMSCYLRKRYHNQHEIEELILSELIHRGVLPTLI